MDEDAGARDPDRHLRNLQAVARHLAESGAASAAPRGGSGDERASVWKRRLATLGPLGVLLLFLLGKFKLLIPLLKFAKLGTLASMVVAVWAYALLWGLPFAVGFVLLIFVHELGHALVMRQQGIRAGAPVFIPFVGAVIAMKSLPRNAWVEALVGIGGPVLGSAGAAVCLLVGWGRGSPFWYGLAYTGFLINLFNLIPVSPLDGGRIVGVISRWLWFLGFAVGVLVFLLTRSPILFLILLLGLFRLGTTLRGPRPGYFDVPPRRRWLMGAAYFGLVALLALGMWAAAAPLQDLQGGAPAAEASSPAQLSAP